MLLCLFDFSHHFCTFRFHLLLPWRLSTFLEGFYHIVLLYLSFSVFRLTCHYLYSYFQFFQMLVLLSVAIAKFCNFPLRSITLMVLSIKCPIICNRFWKKNCANGTVPHVLRKCSSLIRQPIKILRINKLKYYTTLNWTLMGHSSENTSK